MSPARRTVTREELAAPIVPLADAIPLVLGRFGPLEPVEVPLREALGLVCAERVAAPFDVPGFPSSAMDGYAVRSADLAGASRGAPAVLRVVADLPAGAEPAAGPLAPGTAAKIMTGGPIPDGADAVVPWEDAEERPGGEVGVLVAQPAGKHVRPRGEDLAAGAVVVEPGTVLRPVHVGSLAMLGRTAVRAHPRPRLAVLSTGEELVAPGEPLRPGRVYDSNAPLLAAMCEGAGGRVVRVGRAGDDPGEIARWIAAAAAEADLVVTSGGASVGEHDWMREVLEREGELTMWRVALKPGKPIALGRLGGAPVLALPGNPGSVFACAHTFVLRAVRRMAGRDPEPRTVRARLGAAVRGSPSRTQLTRVRLEGARAVVLPAQSSVVLSNLIPADGYAVVPPGGLPEGAEVTVELID